MKKICIIVLASFFFTTMDAQWKWFNPLEATCPVIQNQGWTEETGKTFSRLPERAKNKVPETEWDLSGQSAGLSIRFYCNAPEIKIRYAVNGPLQLNHMPATSVSGIDLYAVDSDGRWNFCSGDFAFNDTIVYHYNRIPKDTYHDSGYEYHLYLPLYNNVSWLEIGIPGNDKNTLEFVPVSSEKPIVVYGTSVVQGACATRPALAWTSIIERLLEYPVINLGFSGSAKMEKDVIGYISELDARLFILDCMPNLYDYDKKWVAGRIMESVKQIRKKHNAPILLVEHTGNSNIQTDSMRLKTVTDINEVALYAYQTLQSEGYKNIYFLYSDEFNIPADGWVDYIHYNDIGMNAHAYTVEKKIREILDIPKGNGKTTIPVTQRREPYNYEWGKRHRDILALNKQSSPKSVIIGNSITHFWGGEPAGPTKNGPKSWDTFMEPAGFRNLGFGWDRIENVLWRVYHDELDGFEAEKIVLMIGTNNLDTNSDGEIVEGIGFLLSAIKKRQPNAKIKVVGILPRRDREERVNTINQQLEEMATKDGHFFQYAGNILLDTNGRIDETLFSDGLHPNEKGYELLGMFIAEEF